MLNTQDSAVLVAIFQAVATGGDWPAMLTHIAEYLRADAITLFTVHGAWDSTGPVSDTTPDLFASLRPGRVYTGEELRDRALAGSRFDKMSDLRALGLRGPADMAWIIAGRRQEVFRAVDSAALAALGPHLVQAFALAGQISSAAARADHAEQILRRLGIGRLEFDVLGRCTAQDTTARDLLARAGLSASQLPVQTAGLQQVTEKLELLAMPMPSGSTEVLLRATDLPLPDATLIAQALGLTQAEARLARALGQGARLSDAAQALGITLETARYYSKQIFAKTGLRGQPDLMRRLWSGLLALR